MGKDHLKRCPPSEDIPRVSLDDPEAAIAALKDVGVCIFTDIASHEELEHGQKLFWDFVKNTELGIDPTDPHTLRNELWHKLGFANSGVVTEFSVGQSEFLWYCRMLPKVRQVFEVLWGTEDLVSSFDGCGVARNPFIKAKSEQGENWATMGGWYHVDQNGKYEPDLKSYQGLLNFFEATPASGSTVVVPRSYRELFDTLTADPARQKVPSHKHHIRLGKGDDYEKYCSTAVQVVLKPGDFLVWDSRTIHCSQGIAEGASASEVLPSREDDILARLVAYVCMIPRERLYKTKMPRIRRMYVTKGMTATHRPDEEVEEKRGKAKVASGYKPPRKGDPKWELV